MTEEKRSPLKAKPLRVAGQSLDRAMVEFFDDHIMTPLVVATLMWTMVGVEWFRHFFPFAPNPWLFTLMAIGVTAYIAWRVMGMLRRFKALKLGRDGERAVGEFLERLREQGIHVFHDVPGDKFNVDHVLIGPRGVFVVETKTLSKPARGDFRISFDGEQVTVMGSRPERDPVVQARALGSWLRDILFQSTGRKVSVRPIVTYPGWFIDPPPKGTRSDVWVLNTKVIPDFIEYEREVLTPEDVKLLSFHLSRYVRGRGAE